MPGIRSFIAIPLDQQLLQQITETIQLLKKTVHGGVSWVQPGSIHLTLKFFGDVEQQKMVGIKSILQTVVPHFTQFEMNASGLGCFPNLERPRVIWIGLHAPAELKKLQENIEAAYVELGFELEKRKFSPHLTLGRIKPYAQQDDIIHLQRAIGMIPAVNLGTTHARDVVLYKSDLLPSGAVYSPLLKVQLRKNEEGGN